MVDRRAIDIGRALGGTAVGRLKKSDAERLLADFDADPVAALTVALRIALDLPGATWRSLLATAPLDAGRRMLLLDNDQSSLDELAAELNERRTLAPEVSR